MPQRRAQRSTSSSSKQKLTGPSAIIVLLIFALIVVYEALQDNQTPDQSSSNVPQTSAPALTAPAEKTAVSANPDGPLQGISVWFTDPLAKQTSGGPENHLVDAINNAKTSIDMAIYNLTLDNVGNALLDAHKRGVTVRIAMESEAMEKDLPEKLQEAGIPIVGDQREGLMHNKFTIIDRQEVWMGSMNYTSTSAYKDFNNLVRFQSQDLVNDYQAEFNQMFEQKKFGNDKEAVSPGHETSVEGVPVAVYFSPEDDVATHVIPEIEQAKKSINFLAYSFTSDDIASAMRARADDGVQVKGVFDESQNKSNKGGEFDQFKKDGVDVSLDGISGLLHDKVIIIDGKTVITGSYNFSANAERTNDENLVIIHSQEIADQYLQHFNQVYESAQK